MILQSRKACYRSAASKSSKGFGEKLTQSTILQQISQGVLDECVY